MLSVVVFNHLFSPIAIGGMVVKNRLVMPPMSVNFGVDENGFVTEQHWEYLAARARGGTGMIVVGGGAVHPSGLDLPRMPPVWDDKFIGPLRTMTRIVQGAGARFGMQLLHGGRQAYHGQRVAPSPIPALAVIKGVPRELTREEIGEMVWAHGDAALRCRKAGFDFVEIHAAHGYLISEFLAEHSNQRSDDYGGSFENRARFLLEILKDIRVKAGSDFPVGVRINGDDCVGAGWGIQDACRLAPILQEAGADWLHVSAGIYGSSPVTIPSMYIPHGCFVHLAEEVKKTVSIPVIAVGRIKNPEMADRLIREGKADMVAMGRAHLADPDLAMKAMSGEISAIRPCIGCCKGCIEQALALEESTCVMNPEVGREYLLAKRSMDAAAGKKKVVIAGAGPAGMVVAARASIAGHKVILIEEKGKAGGMAAVAALAPGRSEIGELIDYRLRELENQGVEVRLNVTITKALINEIQPDVAVVASGGLPEIPQIEGLFDTEMELHVYTDVLERKTSCGDKVIVLGGGGFGLQVADFLAEIDRDVVVLNRDLHFARQMAPNDRTSLMDRLKKPNVRLFKQVVIRKFLPDGVVFDRGGEDVMLKGFSDMVIAEGFRSVRNVSEIFVRRNVEVHVIGDAKSPRTLLDCIAEADDLGRAL
jgi:2,4-dienoyl-CoA reductase-like NADH-dependent reductase (Old Yellow Enzyme family)/thioredoxin reductase